VKEISQQKRYKFADLRIKLANYMKKVPIEPPTIDSKKDPRRVGAYENIRGLICSAGLKTENRLKSDLKVGGKHWFWKRYDEWLNDGKIQSKCKRDRLPAKERLKFFRNHFNHHTGRVLEELEADKKRSSLIVLDLCDRQKQKSIMNWTTPLLHDLCKTSVTGDLFATPGIMAACTRGVHHPARTWNILSKASGERFSGLRDVVLVPILCVRSFEETLQKVEEAASFVKPGGVLFVTLKTSSCGTTLSQMLDLETHLSARGFARKPKSFNVEELKDISEAATLILRKGV